MHENTIFFKTIDYTTDWLLLIWYFETIFLIDMLLSWSGLVITSVDEDTVISWQDRAIDMPCLALTEASFDGFLRFIDSPSENRWSCHSFSSFSCKLCFMNKQKEGILTSLSGRRWYIWYKTDMCNTFMVVQKSRLWIIKKN